MFFSLSNFRKMHGPGQGPLWDPFPEQTPPNTAAVNLPNTAHKNTLRLCIVLKCTEICMYYKSYNLFCVAFQQNLDADFGALGSLV